MRNGNRITDMTSGIYSKLASFFRSKRFFYGIMALAALQGAWYALSVQPTYFDEGRHIGFIQIYAENTNPIIAEQNPQWDVLGDVTRDPAYLYYYLMGLFLRLVSVVANSFQAQVIILRFINIAFFVVGLVVYRKVLLEALKAKSSMTVNFALLLLVLVPAIAPLPGVINYDCLIFLLSGFLLLFALRVIRAKPSEITVNLVAFLSLGLLGSVIKFTFIALFLPLSLYIAYGLLFRRKKIIKNLVAGFKIIRLPYRLGVILLLVLSLALFIERPVKNYLVYSHHVG